MAENKWVSLGLFHPYKWTYFTLLNNWFWDPPCHGWNIPFSIRDTSYHLQKAHFPASHVSLPEGTWRIIPVSQWLGSPYLQAIKRQFIRGNKPT